ncbi:MAG: cobalt transporter CbiM [Anaerolineaceae bacterium]|nr:cobalt transporter CbiM [Anaerolineaceae bacterium]
MTLKKSVKKIPRWMLLYYGLLALWLSTTAMHIPDGYLSPVTCIMMFILVLPFWVRGVRILRAKISAKNIPLVALMAAFSFVIMMFNIPIPGGTTAHAVGGALIAILLGPEIAAVTVSIALLIQALFFGDGGILSFGANCFNMAVVLPYVSYAIYQVLTKNTSITSRRRIVGAAVGAWFGLTVAAFCAGFEFGVQPLLFHTANGTPLYAPYPLSVSIPAMVVPHALVASVVEGLVTALIVAYLQRVNRSAIEMVKKEEIAPEMSGFARWRILWIGLAVLVVATPIGLLAPGTAWGEWGAQELTSRGLSFVPQGLAKLSGLWGAPMKDYDLPALGNSNLGYILSAVVGILVIVLVVWLFTTLVTYDKKNTLEVVKSK